MADARFLRVSARAYRYLRFLCIANAYLVGMVPEQGIVAGCTMADLNIRKVCREGLAS